jgi:hypothetical protein
VFAAPRCWALRTAWSAGAALALATAMPEHDRAVRDPPFPGWRNAENTTNLVQPAADQSVQAPTGGMERPGAERGRRV